MSDWFENLVNKDYLQDNLTFASLYIALFENMTDYVVSSVKDFLCNISVKNGKMVCTETSEYRTQIRNRIVDDKGNKDITKASFLWLVDHRATFPTIPSRANMTVPSSRLKRQLRALTRRSSQRKPFRTMCLQTAQLTRASRENLPRIWMQRRKFAFMPSCREPSKSLHR